jgi:hypothetical protein
MEGWKRGLKGQLLFIVDGSRSGVLVDITELNEKKYILNTKDAVKRPRDL